MSLLIKNATLVLPDGPFPGDLRVVGGKIAEIGQNLPAGESKVLDGKDRLVFPGFIDTHTHFAGIPHLADDFESGTRAALAGGTTTILDFATQEKGEDLLAPLARWHSLAQGRCSCHYSFHMAITDWNNRAKNQISELIREGVTSFKVYLAYEALRLSDAHAFQVVQAVAQEGGIVSAHCENGDLVQQGIAAQKAMGNLTPAAHPASRPALAEGEAVTRWLAIGEMAGAPVHVVHLSSRRGLEAVRNARARGQELYVETCPQYLLLDDEKYSLPDFEGAKYVCSPPLRSGSDCVALWSALLAGEIDTLATDHCSFHFHGGKDLGRDDFSKIPNGLPGVEHRPVLLYTQGVAQGLLTLRDMARLLAEQPARLFGLFPQKGVLAVGSDADIVIWNRNYTSSITSAGQWMKVDYNPYEGMKTIGRAETVILDGEIVVSQGRVTAEKRGRYVKRGLPRFWR